MTRAGEEARVARAREQIAADLAAIRRRWAAGRWLPVGAAILAGLLAGAWAGWRERSGRARTRGV
ncbi:MAG: hypothetical protein QN173_05795 [Armatimonadota bacterium]|nr:hypothetical protein [Armatimonadota bacterium]MDR7402423.1 hypothetical protein [Armatimonadota bacterium]MDR7404237.1 hypothetical protein [Armatimonadota bacterium]MDR7437556.1 hypothetical protein [Armatimonadota bacterium]MDR7472150.1 hypothetical protein [Armatimonadota bacterium]